jgi:tRNA-(ms[2]io[6]A)-hydroxylase
LSHFRLVLTCWAARHLRRLAGWREASRAVTRRARASVDRLLVAALIEARSCERFGLLRDGLEDRELAAFFGSLFESEARHHSTYVRLAKGFAEEEQVVGRLRELAVEEARIIGEGDDVPRMHS